MRKFSIYRTGFTLIEILIAVSLIGIMMIAISQVFISILQTQTKGEIIKGVKQNGDYAFSVMESMIRNAKEVTDPDPTSCGSQVDEISIKNVDDYITRFYCTGGATSRVSSRSATSDLFLTSSEVVASNCHFIVNCPSSSPKYVWITFTLSQVNVSAGTEGTATETFEGTVSLRNYE
ncbi:hypothetical protein A2773_00080 [Candidatus Gottesmanbacteria bacterium RIFCSPHIGHO2_01_FULL_39_10]|uniref:Uncharacterized protein n=1 Tax=Candidatus Gottesmanbacteria bacterium RIFCSPHIGHO2_01_FULL_39_10 TaxID=1798375 RepID=A0A1F5ZNM6_9BACT|nr:MAG: hypothetical protein A2773_00080 [Candidatus Gottesmanbacteria bacterium RIFCSPHIGHO2_01_FULL_39_10]